MRISLWVAESIGVVRDLLSHTIRGREHVRSKPKRGSQQIRDGPGLTERVTHRADRHVQSSDVVEEMIVVGMEAS